MKYIISVILIVASCYIGYYVIRYSNRYRLTMIFGKKGSGKSTTLCKLAFKYLKKGWTVYCTEPIPGTLRFDVKELGKKHFKEHSAILIDEVGMIWDNRDFKSFEKHVRNWFKYQRHAKCRVYLFSQTFDIDKKLRDLTDEMYMMVNVLGVLSYGKRIKRKLVVVHPTGEAESRIADDLVISPFFLAPFGARMFVWIPKYARYFDSFDMWEMPPMDADLIEFPADMPSRYIPRWYRKRYNKLRKAS